MLTAAYIGDIVQINEMAMLYPIVITLLFALLHLPSFQLVKTNNVCPYFGSARQPKEAYSLTNCTWYKENACCERTEVVSVFSEMPALLTSNKQCYHRINYLMCYFCSPQQHVWYNDTLAVCRKYCDALYRECKSAKHAGVAIGTKYKSGIEFCEAQLFKVVDENCFDFDPSHFDASSTMQASSWLMVVLLSFFYTTS